MNHFISDLHLSGVDQFMAYVKPFEDVREMNRAIFDNINRMVYPEETLWVLGDFFNYTRDDHWSWKKVAEGIQAGGFKLPKHTKLIFGNNEIKLLNEEFGGDIEKFTQWLHDLGFESVFDTGRILKMHGIDFYLNHFPELCSKEHLNLFGHVHFAGKMTQDGINVSADVNGYSPVSEIAIHGMITQIVEYHKEDANMQRAIHISDYTLWDNAYYNWKG